MLAARVIEHQFSLSGRRQTVGLSRISTFDWFDCLRGFLRHPSITCQISIQRDILDDFGSTILPQKLLRVRCMSRTTTRSAAFSSTARCRNCSSAALMTLPQDFHKVLASVPRKAPKMIPGPCHWRHPCQSHATPSHTEIREMVKLSRSLVQNSSNGHVLIELQHGEAGGGSDSGRVPSHRAKWRTN